MVSGLAWLLETVTFLAAPTGAAAGVPGATAAGTPAAGAAANPAAFFPPFLAAGAAGDGGDGVAAAEGGEVREGERRNTEKV